MKRSFFLNVFILLFSYQVFAVSVDNPRVPEQMVILDTAVNAIPTAYSSAAGSQIFSKLGNVTRFQVFNKTSEEIIISVNGKICGGDSVDHFVAPGSGVGNEVLKVSVNQVICLKSGAVPAAPINSGLVYISAW